MSYDVFDRRIAKSGGPTDAVTRYVYEGVDVVLDFVDPDGDGPQAVELAMRYLHGPAIDQVLAQEGVAGVQWLLADHLGTTRDLVDNAGNVVNHILFDGFGQVVSQTNPAFGTRYLFTGREFDPETGLYYYRARYYDASIGRFIGQDPISFLGGPNAYAYVANRPIGSRDPLGLLGAGQLSGDAKGNVLDNNWIPELQKVSDGAAAFGDALTSFPGLFDFLPDEQRARLGLGERVGSLTEHARKALGVNDVVNKCSLAYAIGGLLATPFPGLGDAFKLKKIQKGITGALGELGELVDDILEVKDIIETADEINDLRKKVQSQL